MTIEEARQIEEEFSKNNNPTDDEIFLFYRNIITKKGTFNQISVGIYLVDF